MGSDEPALPELNPAIAGEEVEDDQFDEVNEEIIVKNPVPDIDKKEYLKFDKLWEIA